LKQLQETGFDILSLANNHSNDYGKSALRYTRALCADYMILCAGTSLDFDEYSLLIKKVGGKKVGFVFVYAVYVSPDPIRLAEMLDALTVETDMQIAYIHWGDEYMLSHSASQESLAQMMIDNGVDAVIGHHPHVVQDIALYKNKPIFYSLGNFIFDQYFSTDVQEGLGVTLAITDAESTYSLIPFTSVGTHAQPRVMEEEKHRLFNRILNDIQSVDGVDIENGSLTIPNRN
jgi:poly-gamma-glutamate synthesis protein (capsule biosynthesis protein)